MRIIVFNIVLFIFPGKLKYGPQAAGGPRPPGLQDRLQAGRCEGSQAQPGGKNRVVFFLKKTCVLVLYSLSGWQLLHHLRLRQDPQAVEPNPRPSAEDLQRTWIRGRKKDEMNFACALTSLSHILVDLAGVNAHSEEKCPIFAHLVLPSLPFSSKAKRGRGRPWKGRRGALNGLSDVLAPHPSSLRRSSNSKQPISHNGTFLFPFFQVLDAHGSCDNSQVNG